MFWGFGHETVSCNLGSKKLILYELGGLHKKIFYWIDPLACVMGWKNDGMQEAQI